MKTEGATHAIVVTGASKQGVDFLGRSLSAAEPELQHAPHGRRQIFLVELPFNRFAIERLCRAALLLQPLLQASNLIDRGDGAAGELGKLCVDLRCRSLRNLTRSFGKLPIDMKAARVDLAAEHPQRLFRGRQRRQPIVSFALDSRSCAQYPPRRCSRSGSSK